MKALEKAISIAGGLKGIADACGVTPQAVWNWTDRGVVPANSCPAIEFLVGGAVPCEDLNVETSWVRLPDASWPNPSGRPLVDPSPKKLA